jgi:transcriptional regulator GlxA family with amidase domain
MQNCASKLVRVGFLQLPRYSMIAFSSAIEPLRMANHLGARSLYRCSTVSFDGTRVTASNGLRVGTDGAIRQAGHLEVLFVCGGIDVRLSCDKALID